MALADEWTREEPEIVDGWPVGMTYADVGAAVATWFNFQGGDKTVAEAAAAFNISEFGVRKAVAAAGNPWFTIEGDQLVADGI